MPCLRTFGAGTSYKRDSCSSYCTVLVSDVMRSGAERRCQSSWFEDKKQRDDSRMAAIASTGTGREGHPFLDVGVGRGDKKWAREAALLARPD